MIKYKNQIIGVIGFSILIILIAFFSDIVLKITSLGERYLSDDSQIQPEGIQLIKDNLFRLILLILGLSVFFFFNLYKVLFRFTSNFIDWNEVRKFFFTDDICNKKKTPYYLMLFSIIPSLFLHAYLLFIGEPTQEGILEKYMSILFLIAAIVLVISITQINRNQFSAKIKKQIILIIVTISVLLFLVFGEEISWGQRIFNWESTGVFNDYNYQKETNVHNFFNPLMTLIYPIVGLSSFITLLCIWFFPNKKSYLFKLFIPPPSLFFIVFFMACSSYIGHSEIYEELLAVFILLYSIRIYICLRFQKTT